jgi:hypothetical protein
MTSIHLCYSFHIGCVTGVNDKRVKCVLSLNLSS